MELVLKLIDWELSRGYHPRIVLIDAGYENNSSFLSELENRQLKYLGGIAKNRKVTVSIKNKSQETMRVDELAASLPSEVFKKVELG